MKKNNKFKFKSLYYTGLSIYAVVAFFAIVLVVSIVIFSYNKIEEKNKAKLDSVYEKTEIPVVKKIIYDTVPVYDTIKHVAHPHIKR